MRRTTLLVIVLLAFGACAAASAAATHKQKVMQFQNLALSARPFADAVIERRLTAVARHAYHTGVYQTKDGISVRVYTSDAYPVDPAADQSAVDFLGSLLHGPELGDLTLYILTPDEVHAQCGFGATACYYPARQALYTPGEDSDGLPVEQVLAHEYGHHVAAHRLNTPWQAADWGPKRWATYMGICPGVAAGRFFPGAEPPDAGYRENPGEGWAEAYRAYNARAAQTWPEFGWPIVDEAFEPDAPAFAAIREDVLDPWTHNAKSTRTGRLRARTTTDVSLDTPFDGTLSVHVSGTAAPTADVLDADGRPRTSRSSRITTIVCGEDGVTVAIHARRSGTYRLSVSEP